MAQEPPELPGQFLCLLGRIVDSVDQDIFEGDPLVGLLHILPGRFQQFLIGIGPIHRHQLRPDLFIGRVKGDGQGHLGEFFRELPDLRQDPTGGYGDAPKTHPKAPFVMNIFQEPGKVFIIVKGFSHPHDHHMVHFLSDIPAYRQHLVQDLPGGQVPDQPSFTGGAESTTHPATGLGGDADRVPVAVLHQHALYELSVRQPEQVLPGPILLGHLDRLRHQRFRVRFLRQFFPQSLRQVAHFLKGPHAFVQPLKDLLCPELLLAGFRHIVFQFGKRHGFDSCFILHRLHVISFKSLFTEIITNPAAKNNTPEGVLPLLIIP